MSNSFSTVEKTGWFSRMKSAFVGVLIGIIMVPGSAILLGWNEYRTIHRTQGLKQGASLVTSIENTDRLRDDLESQLVHLTGNATTEDLLRDEDFAIEENAIKLKRQVEMFQWVESTSTKSKKNVGGGTTKTKTYSYDREWADDREDSQRFENPQGHHNPPLTFDSKTDVAPQVMVGVYELSDSLKDSINSFEPIGWSDEMFAQLSPEFREHVVLEGEYIYWSAIGKPVLNAPEVGDHRVRFELVKPTDVSLVAKQTGSTFAAFEVPNGEKIQKLSVGRLTAEKMFEAFQSENAVFAWLLRLLGFVLSCAGFYLMVSPLSVFADIIPFLGSMTRSLTGVVALLLGTCVSAVTIAVAWIAVRPLIGIPLMVLAVAAIVMLYRVLANRKKEPSADEESIPYVPMA